MLLASEQAGIRGRTLAAEHWRQNWEDTTRVLWDEDHGLLDFPPGSRQFDLGLHVIDFFSKVCSLLVRGAEEGAGRFGIQELGAIHRCEQFGNVRLQPLFLWTHV